MSIRLSVASRKKFEDEQRADSAHWYSKWTFVAAAAVIVGVIGVVTLYWH